MDNIKKLIEYYFKMSYDELMKVDATKLSNIEKCVYDEAVEKQTH